MIEQEHDELKLREEWMVEAKKQTPETIGTFIQKLAAFPHDYGTIVRAVAAAALGAAYAVNRGPHGGITGFQASMVQWDFLTEWNGWKSTGVGCCLLDYSRLLYPQYEESFQTIPAEVWERVQRKASELLDSEEGSEEERFAVSSVLEHWMEIVDGKVPFGLRVEGDLLGRE